MRMFQFVGSAVWVLATLVPHPAIATVIPGGTSAAVDGWNITVPIGVTINATSGATLDLQYIETFTAPAQVLSVGFQPVPGAVPATNMDITSEAVTNSSASDWNAFHFSLVNLASPSATFDGIANVFVPPFGPGVNYTTVSLTAGNTFLTYGGTQLAGSTSTWGSANPGDNLLIDTPAGSDFILQQFPTAVPEPTTLSLLAIGNIFLLSRRR
jgi:PEP-CTERM motif